MKSLLNVCASSLFVVLVVGCAAADPGSSPENIGSVEQAVSNWLWPLAGADSHDWVINNYVDLGGQVDYQGGDRTYLGHDGIDIDVASLRATDANVAVRAVAGGQVVSVTESNFDRNLTFVCNGSHNELTVRTPDGYNVSYCTQEGFRAGQRRPNRRCRRDRGCRGQLRMLHSSASAPLHSYDCGRAGRSDAAAFFPGAACLQHPSGLHGHRGRGQRLAPPRHHGSAPERSDVSAGQPIRDRGAHRRWRRRRDERRARLSTERHAIQPSQQDRGGLSAPLGRRLGLDFTEHRQSGLVASRRRDQRSRGQELPLSGRRRQRLLG